MKLETIRFQYGPEAGTLPRFAFPGGYPLIYFDGESNILCPNCANRTEAESDQWDVTQWPDAYGVNWEDPALFCDQCSERIESAYAEE